MPIPPLREQHEIRTIVDEQLSVYEAVELQVRTHSARATRLRQSILKRAFEGKLVPQDPKDEPAGVLLERIRRGRAELEGEGKGGQGRIRRKIRQKTRL